MRVKFVKHTCSYCKKCGEKFHVFPQMLKKNNQVVIQEVGIVQMWNRLALYGTTIPEAAHKKSFDCHR